MSPSHSLFPKSVIKNENKTMKPRDFLLNNLITPPRHKSTESNKKTKEINVIDGIKCKQRTRKKL